MQNKAKKRVNFKKKAGISDAIFYIIVIFMVAIVSVVSWKLMKVLDDEMQRSSQISSGGKSIMTDIRGRFISVVDGSFLIILVGVLIAVCIGAFLIPIHPAMFWISLPILTFLIFLGAIYGNVFESIRDTTDFRTEVSDFPILSYVMANYVLVLTIMVILVSIFLYAKNRPSE